LEDTFKNRNNIKERFFNLGVANQIKNHNYYVMKQVININFQGQVVPIEVTAFDLLKQYTQSLSDYFATEEGKEEIINDIENRIGELFQERLKSGATCITDDDVAAIIKSMGRPEDFEDDASQDSKREEKSSNQSAPFNPYNISGNKRLFRSESSKVIGGVCGGLSNYLGIDVVVVRIIFVVLFGALFIPYLILWIAVPSSASTVIGGPRKRLFRDMDEKVIGGVCSGIAHYFGINVWIPRVLFLIPLLSVVSNWHLFGGFPNLSHIGLGFSPGALIVYIILWLVIPEASSTAEKLEMRGEKVDMNTIKNSVMEEMKGMQQRAEKFGKEAKTFATGPGKVVGDEMIPMAKRTSRSLGDIIILLIKIFAYIIIGCLAIAVIGALVGLAIVCIGLFPIKDFVLTAGWQNVFAWGTFLFFIVVPIIGSITWIIRRLAKINTNRKMMRISFAALWVLGWVCFIGLITNVLGDFKASGGIYEQEVALSNPLVKKLEVTTLSPNNKFYRNVWFNMEPFSSIEDDTAYIRNVTVQIVKSNTDSFRVTMLKMANGRNRRSADSLISTISYNAHQVDSLLVLDRGIQINKTDKFRNQRVIITIYVPVGKQIRVADNTSWGNNMRIGPWNNDWYMKIDQVEEGWDTNVDYVMKADGLYTLDGVPADSWKKDNKSGVNDGDMNNMEINDGKQRVLINERGIQVEDIENENYRVENERHQRALDSIQRKRNVSQQRVKDSLQMQKEKIDRELKKLNTQDQGASAKSDRNQFVLPIANPMMLLMIKN
jgi:phage shock protein PspC (stress-responsive transcriptional regulator)